MSDTTDREKDRVIAECMGHFDLPDWCSVSWHDNVREWPKYTERAAFLALLDIVPHVIANKRGSSDLPEAPLGWSFEVSWSECMDGSQVARSACLMTALRDAVYAWLVDLEDPDTCD